MSDRPREVLAAGTVCWRRVYDDRSNPRILVMLIHRVKQRDVSFPKGKLDPGESMPQAAIRETHEETGYRVGLGINLGTVHYRLQGGRTKTVQYWAARVSEKLEQATRFKPNSEVDRIEWVPLEKAAKRLSYAADREILEVFARLVEHRDIETFSVILLRHAKAEPRSDAYPVDHLRPLADRGEEQAEILVPILAAFRPRRIVSSTAARCLSTVAPIAEHLGRPVKGRDGLSQDAWDSGETTELRRIVGKTVRKGRNTILCTHRPVLPDVARELALATGSPLGDYLRDASSLPPGGFSVFHLSRRHPDSGILGVETYPLKP